METEEVSMSLQVISLRPKSVHDRRSIADWENDGGALETGNVSLVGTENQIAWAEQIRANVDAEFNRVAAALESVVTHQTGSNQVRTRLAITILEGHHGAVMARNDAGYFIKEWQEIRDQVRKMVTADTRHKTLTLNKVTATESTDH
jgi:hypothetical protein